MKLHRHKLLLAMSVVGFVFLNLQTNVLFDWTQSSRMKNAIGLGADHTLTRNFPEISHSETEWFIQCDDIPRGHPHQGARHPNGSFGCFVNATIERLKKTSIMELKIDHPLCPPDNVTLEGNEDEGKAVIGRIKEGLFRARERLPSLRPVKILCIVYTVHFTETNRNLASIANTWGKSCDGFFAASNYTDHTVGSIDLPHHGPESYGNMYQKIRSIWTYAFDHYLNDYDYFYMCGDDVYVIVDHLRFFLGGDREVQLLENGPYLDRLAKHFEDNGSITNANRKPRPLIFGMPMVHSTKGFPIKFPVLAGGSGYILNRAALSLWGNEGADSFKTTITDSKEDFYIATFFRKKGVFISGSQDSMGSFRFAQGVQTTATFDGQKSPIRPQELRKRFGFKVHKGINYTSQYQITFHLKREKARIYKLGGYFVDDLIYRYHAIFQGWCE